MKRYSVTVEHDLVLLAKDDDAAADMAERLADRSGEAVRDGVVVDSIDSRFDVRRGESGKVLRANFGAIEGERPKLTAAPDGVIRKPEPPDVAA